MLTYNQPLAGGTGTKMTLPSSGSTHCAHQSRPHSIHDHELPLMVALLVAAMAHAATSTTKGTHTADDAHQVECTRVRLLLASA